jgi:hypothetical protein
MDVQGAEIRVVAEPRVSEDGDERVNRHHGPSKPGTTQ